MGLVEWMDHDASAELQVYACVHAAKPLFTRLLRISVTKKEEKKSVPPPPDAKKAIKRYDGGFSAC